MRIESLQTQPDRAGRYKAVLSDGTVLRLYRQTVEDFGLYPGLELEDGALERLNRAAGQTSAKMRAVRILSATGVSGRDLQQRLIQKGERPEDARQAVAWMEEMRLIDDRQTARSLVDRCVRQGLGMERARQLLYEKRIPREYWQEALEDYPDQQEKITEFLRSRLRDPGDRREVKRAVDALIRRGHRYDVIRRALEALDLETEEFPEEY